MSKSSKNLFLGEWESFLRQLRATGIGHRDKVRQLDKIVGRMPTGINLRLQKRPFFAFNDPQAEQGYREMMTMRKAKSYHWGTNAGVFVFLAVLNIYAFATCDIDKQRYMREWTTVAVVCGTSLLLLPATIWGTTWCFGRINQEIHLQHQKYSAMHLDVMFSASRKVKTLGWVSAGVGDAPHPLAMIAILH